MPRELATTETIDAFLTTLAANYRGELRLYLTGGSQMVLLGMRGQTEDIDYVAVTPDDRADFTQAIRSTILDLNISAEPAGPGDFIPLPAAWKDRARFVKRYGRIDVFLFDPVALALSKIERGSARDIDDALSLVRSGEVALADLRTAFDDIVSRLGTESLSVDESDYRRKFDAFQQLALAAER